MIIQTYLTIPDDSFQSINFDKVKQILEINHFIYQHQIDDKMHYIKHISDKPYQYNSITFFYNKSYELYRQSCKGLIKTLMSLTNKNFHEVLVDIQD
jgi:hypothetical protein